jgi:secondary thiamine-phosphate synthase enzyme
MKQSTHRISVDTRGKGLYEFTHQTVSWVRESGIRTGLLTVFVQHTSASLTIQENADPDVIRDLKNFFSKLVPDDPSLYIHTIEGPDDMPAHIRSALTQTSIGIPVTGGTLTLGTWQGLYLFEHRNSAHRRSIQLHLLGE